MLHHLNSPPTPPLDADPRRIDGMSHLHSRHDSSSSGNMAYAWAEDRSDQQQQNNKYAQFADKVLHKNGELKRELKAEREARKVAESEVAALKDIVGTLRQDNNTLGVNGFHDIIARQARLMRAAEKELEEGEKRETILQDQVRQKDALMTDMSNKQLLLQQGYRMAMEMMENEAMQLRQRVAQQQKTIEDMEKEVNLVSLQSRFATIQAAKTE